MLIFFWTNANAVAMPSSFGHPFSGIRPLTPAMLRAMQRRAEAKARRARIRADDEETAAVLLGD